jgi:hypothetical protein
MLMGQAHIGRRIVADVRTAMSAGGWNAGVALALAIPDMGGSIEFPREKRVGKRYRLWATRYFVPHVTAADVEFLSAEELYRVRCSFLHTGTLRVTASGTREFPGIVLYEDDAIDVCPSRGGTQLDAESGSDVTYHVGAKQFCEWLCLAAEEWLDDIQNDDAKQAALRGAWSVQRLFFLPSSRLRDSTSGSPPVAAADCSA